MRLAATYSFRMLVVSEMVRRAAASAYLIVNAQYLLSVHLLYVGGDRTRASRDREQLEALVALETKASAHGAPISILEWFGVEAGRRRALSSPTCSTENVMGLPSLKLSRRGFTRAAAFVAVVLAAGAKARHAGRGRRIQNRQDFLSAARFWLDIRV